MNVLLVDDHRLIRDALKVLLEQADIDVVGQAENGREAVAMALGLRPHVVVMDLVMPELNGIDAPRRLIAAAPDSKVIGLTVSSDARNIRAMFGAGAVGYLLKSSAAYELVHAIREVAGGHKYVSPAIASVVVETTAKAFMSRKLALRLRTRARTASPSESAKCFNSLLRARPQKRSPSGSNSAQRRSRPTDDR